MLVASPQYTCKHTGNKGVYREKCVLVRGKPGEGVVVFREKSHCEHPRHHAEGFQGFPVISTRPQIIKMKTLIFKVYLKELLVPHDS